MSFKNSIKALKDFIKKHWKEILGAIGAIGKVVLYIVSKIERLPSAWWIGLALIFWLFIFTWALLTTIKTTRPILRAIAIVGIIVSTATIGYFGTVGFIYVLTEEPSTVGVIFKRDPSAANLKGSGLTDQAFNEKYTLTFSEPADYVETDFTVDAHQPTVKELLITYEVRPEYQDKVKLSKTTIGVANVAPGFSIDILLVALLSEKTHNPEISVAVEKKFAKRSRCWRLKRWVFERYQDSL